MPADFRLAFVPTFGSTIFRGRDGPSNEHAVAQAQSDCCLPDSKVNLGISDAEGKICGQKLDEYQTGEIPFAAVKVCQLLTHAQLTSNFLDS